MNFIALDAEKAKSMKQDNIAFKWLFQVMVNMGFSEILDFTQKLYYSP